MEFESNAGMCAIIIGHNLGPITVTARISRVECLDETSPVEFQCNGSGATTIVWRNQAGRLVEYIFVQFVVFVRSVK